jgi:multiple sugar transport system substrate-binding protein
MEGVSRRKFLAGATAAAGAAVAPTLLTGCGSSSKKKELVFWNFYSPNPAVGSPDLAAQDKWFRDTVAVWNAQNATKIRLEYVTVLGNPKEATAFAAGEGPDIFLISPGDILRYYSGNALVELGQYMTKEAIDDFFPNNMATRIMDGKVYALPMEIEPLAMFYSKPALEKAGISEAELPKTWDQLVDLGDKLKSKKLGPMCFSTAPGYYQNFTWYPFFWQGGGEVVSKDGTHSVFESKAAVDALTLWQEPIKQGIMPRVEPAAADVITAFTEGYASVYLNGIWNVSAFRQRAPKFEYGIFPIPTPPGGTPTTTLGGWAFVANARGKDPEAAAKFCVWALGSMQPDSIKRMVDWCIHAKSDIAPRKTALEQGAKAGGYDNPIMKQFKDEIFPTGRGEPRYPPVIYKAISDAIQNCQLAGGKPEDQASVASRSIDAYLKSYRGVKIT